MDEYPKITMLQMGKKAESAYICMLRITTAMEKIATTSVVFFLPYPAISGQQRR